LISIFYIGYLVAQYPTNLLMQRYPVGKYLTINFVLWGTSIFCHMISPQPNHHVGATLAATGSATKFSTLAAARFFLGIFESCLNPGFILVTSSWWKREEQTARIGLWYCANGLIGAPSGLIFWAIAHMRVGNVALRFNGSWLKVSTG
jgi:MFS transporter, ACS family, allantoate permease